MKTYEVSVKLLGVLEIEAENEAEAKRLAQDWSIWDVEDFYFEIVDVFCEADYDENGLFIGEKEDGN